jgi:hypothetical protein
MAAKTSAAEPGVRNTYVSKFLSTTGPYGPAVIKAGTVFISYVQAFIICNFNYLRTTTGVKIFLFKIPEAIVRISTRLKDSESLAARTFHFLSHYARPFATLGGGCGKTVLAFMELRSKLDRVEETYYRPKPISYVVFKKNSARMREFTLSLGQQRADYIGASADWLMSVAECENFLRPAFDIKRGPIFSPLASYSGYVSSLRTLYIEGSFLYQTVWLHHKEGKVTVSEAPEGKVSKLVIAGSLLKIALAIIGLTLDFFSILSKRENKPYWLAPANFWLGLVPTLLIPLAYNWWPNVAVEPIRVQARNSSG